MNFNWNELAIAYALSALGVLIALLLSRADRRAYFRWPAYSAMCMALGVIVWNLLRKHVFPADWPLTHVSVLYYGAMANYVLLGLLIGAALGRLTRQRPPPEG